MSEENKNTEEMLEAEVEQENEDIPTASQVEEEPTASGDGIDGVSEGIKGGVESTDLGTQIKDSFLDYAMSVIVARALPDARDGFKPVHRRVIYGMVKMGIFPNVPHKKSARIVGEVMGKYHPHGNTAIYESLARLAQPFAMRHTLIDGHGNFGNQDGDSPAADRYTEARLSKISLEMVRDINKDTVNFSPTYDGDGKEPDVLPSRFPNLLVNGASGIAVGMATNIPPHNLGETIDAVIAILENPNVDTLDLMTNYIHGPDFPGGGVILGRSGIRSYFEEGRGSVKVRAKHHIEQKGDKISLVFTELPYMVNKKTLAKKIIDLADEKILDGIANVADYSSYKIGTKFVVELKRGANPDLVLNHLFKYTKLQDSFPVNLLALDHGVPKTLSLKKALTIYANFQKDVLRRRTRFNKQADMDRLHIIEAMLVVKDHTDEVISIIRSSDDDKIASLRLQERFNIDEVQTEAILSMPTRRLTKLSGIKFVEERDGLTENIKRYDALLTDEKLLEELLISELKEIKEKYADPRKTEISDMEVIEEDEDLIEDKEILITLTKTGYIKRMNPTDFRVQGRGGVGIRGMKTKEDDVVDILTHSRTKVDVLFFTSLGKVYKIRGYRIPHGSRDSKGEPVINLLPDLDKEQNERVLSIISIKEYNESHFLFFVTKKAVVKKVDLTQFERINRNGKKAIVLNEGDELFDVKYTDGEQLISIASKKGMCCTFEEKHVRAMGRAAAGVKGMDLQGSEVVGVSTSSEGPKILTISSLGKGKMTPTEDYRVTGRGAKGVKTLSIKGDSDVEVVTIKAVYGNENILIITDGGTLIKTSLQDVATTGRSAQGVNIIKLKDGETIASVSVEPRDEDLEAQDDPSLDKPAKVEETLVEENDDLDENTFSEENDEQSEESSDSEKDFEE